MNTLDGWIVERMGLSGPLARPALAAWQTERLREAVAYARAASPFYRARRDWPDVEFASPEDVARLPFTTPADLLRNEPPLLALSQGEVARVVTLPSSGTNGPPKRLHFSPDDREATIDFFAQGMGLFTRGGDRVAIAFPGGAVGGIVDGLAVALGRLGADCLRAPAPFDPEALAAWLRTEQPDVVVGPPVPLLAAVRVASCDGGAPLGARAVLLSSDHVASSLARAIGAAFGAEVFQHWGMTETGYGGAVDCACHCGCHLRENELLVEVVDVATGAPSPFGEIGEVVVTTLRRRAVPLLRYRTGDLARFVDAPCRCGSILKRLDGFSGRVGEAVSLPGGGALSLPRLDEVVFAVEGVSDFVATYDEGPPASLSLSIAAPSALRAPAAREDVRARLAAEPVVGAAMRENRLRVDVSFADALLFRREGKRRLMKRDTAPCARCC
jgi:phenylacetate-coenzyme A ligase PaaK-like adenylate-forming protein